MFQILVVEDDRELNRAVCSYLENNGYHAVGCLDANEAYDAMYGGTIFDMIVSDIMMPGVDGFEFARTIREQNQEIPILFMTAREDFPAKQKGFQAGIDDYMVKPINLAAALVSVLAMETAMLDQFGGNIPVFRRWMTGISGGVMCTVVLFLAVRMIRYANLELKKLKKETQLEIF